MELILVLLFLSAPIFYFTGIGVFLQFLVRSVRRSTQRGTELNQLNTAKGIVKNSDSIHLTKKNSLPPSPTQQLPSFLGDHKQNLRAISLLLGLIYVLAVEWGQLPSGLQMPLLSLVFSGVIVYLTHQRSWIKTGWWWALLFFQNAVAFSIFITTNPLLDAINRLTFFGLSIFWLTFLSQGYFPSQITQVLKDSYYFCLTTFLQLMNPQLYGSFLAVPKVSPGRLKVDGQKVVGILVAIPVLVIFHLLFVRINTDYSLFMHDVLHKIWEVIKYIWELDIVVVTIKTITASFFFFILFASKIDQKNKQLAAQQKNYVTIFNSILSLCVGLFLIFVFFQSRLLLTNFASLTFKALSTYVIQGFWELIWVSLIGYTLTLVTLHFVKKDHSLQRPQHTKILLTVFTVELIAIVLFTFHKLFIHQNLFGLKDQRILATAGVALIFLTYQLSLLRIWEKITSRTVFSIQLFAFLSTVTVLNVTNIDLFVTRFNPIHYYVNEHQYKDYSYLLGNSFDNSVEWLKLVAAAKAEQPPQPEDYYYGWYPAFCQKTVVYGPSHHYDQYRYNRLIPQSYLQNKYQYLFEKYDHLEKKSLPEKLAINYHEYQAYQVVSQHRAEFDQLVELFCTK